ncbi:MAG: adenosylcobinamide-GDP ribazoletransferase, partial [Rhodospirillaceae bacterium]|nr:adenosylcobinamide-GDP ribazoletransferase [Rhodospirillales bacterium]
MTREPTAPTTTDSAQPSGFVADLHLACAFLTRLPLPDLGVVADGGLARAMRTFPLVGGAVGLAAGLVFLAAHAVLPPLPAALLAVLVAIVLTGALHEDGLADTADGLGARGGREARLEVMRDSRTGAFGVLAIVFSVGLHGEEAGPRECPVTGFTTRNAATGDMETGDKLRVRPALFADHYSQARLFWRSQQPSEQAHIASSFVFELSKVGLDQVPPRMIANLRNVDEDLARRVAEGLGVPLPTKAQA